MLLRIKPMMLRSFSKLMMTIKSQKCTEKTFHSTVAKAISLGYSFDDGRKLNYMELTRGELNVKFLSKTLSNWLACPVELADKLCEDVPELKRVHLDTIFDSIQFIRANGFSNNFILSNPWILLYTFGTVIDKITILSNIGNASREKVAIFLKLSVCRLTKIVQQWLIDEQSLKNEKFPNRLHLLASKLDCEEDAMARILVKHSSLMTMDLARLSDMLDLLLESGFKRDDIKNNINVFLHNEKILLRRLATLKELGVTPVKTWLLRCPESIFNETMENWRNYDVGETANETPVQYLARRLECSEDHVLYLSHRFPPLLSIRRPKLSATLDFLLKNGFSVKQISLTLHVFRISHGVLQSRLEELKSCGYHPRHLNALCSNKNAYQKLLQKVKQENKEAAILSSCNEN